MVILPCEMSNKLIFRLTEDRDQALSKIQGLPAPGTFLEFKWIIL